MFNKINFFSSFDVLHASLPPGNYFLLIADKTPLEKAHFENNFNVVGALFPRIIYENESYENGIIVAQLNENTYMQIIPNINDTSKLYLTEDIKSLFLIIDGLSPKCDTFLESLYSLLPEKTKIIGSGAGKHNLQHEPVIFDGKTFYQDRAIIIYSEDSIGIGIKHGFEPLVKPLIATETEMHCLKKINFRNAFALYKEAIEKNSQHCLTTVNFNQIANHYPFGVFHFGKDYSVRSPIKTDGENLFLMGNIDQNSIMAILHSTPEQLIAAADCATQKACEHKESPLHNICVVECISRYLFLGDRFKEELIAIHNHFQHTVPSWGMLSISQIANPNEENIQLYNKTCIIGAF
ncbi:MAG: FIST C-terminal domain-containing protein [Sulfurospirillaceae bacterium]|nr:FIST C-terminal domain-containing protein [Sulfurospirillaceae bacterium]